MTPGPFAGPFARPFKGRALHGAMAALSVALIVLVLSTFRQYGVTWDARFHLANGEYAVARYAALFSGTEVDSEEFPWGLTIPGGRSLYGALFDGMGALASRVSPFGVYETRHLLGGLVGVLGVVAVWKIGLLLAGPLAGLSGALALALTPSFYGHMFNNPKDIPFAVSFAWALYYLVRLMRELPRPRRDVWWKLGLAMGCALGIRIGGVLLAGYLMLVLAAGLVTAWLRAPSTGSAGRVGAFLIFGALGSLALAYGVMLVGWPQAQARPFQHPIETLSTLGQFPFLGDVLFRGRLTLAPELPWYYLPFVLLVKLPEPVTLLFVVGIASVAAPNSGRAPSAALVAFTLFPIVYAVASRAVLYDGLRHFLFVVPPICCVAGLGFAFLFERATGLLRWLAVLALAAYLLNHCLTMVRLHPYQYVYYNHLVGGLEGAHRRFETDYWANSYAEAARRLGGIAERELAGDPDRDSYRVWVVGPVWSASYFFPPQLVTADEESEADFVIVYTRENLDRSVAGETLFEVRRMGVPLTVVKDLRRRAAQSRLLNKVNRSGDWGA